MTGPLIHRGRLYGTALALGARLPFTHDDAAAVHFAARLAAVHVGHARTYAEVRDTAMNLQRALLAEPGRPHPNRDLATRFLPSGGGALVGGDEGLDARHAEDDVAALAVRTRDRPGLHLAGPPL
ncbi:hypothetical protein [Streptomyces sp. NPDC052015]|uniref:hypothetical protein n=1 Tax=Streptomyces sp. NPDC052015 TaxID=3154755 RepID=UPI003423471C